MGNGVLTVPKGINWQSLVQWGMGIILAGLLAWQTEQISRLQKLEYNQGILFERNTTLSRERDKNDVDLDKIKTDVQAIREIVIRLEAKI